jgi:DNA primase
VTGKDLFGGGLENADASRLKNRERAQSIKAKCGVQDVAALRGANPTAQAHGWLANCPACHALQTVTISAHGERYRCAAHGCGAEGDVITFEMAATGRDFKGACDELASVYCGARRDDATGDLLALADAAGRVS